MDPGGEGAGVGIPAGEDLVEAIVASARRIAGAVDGGARLAVVGQGRCYFDACHVAVEFLHPVIAGKRAVAAWAGRAQPPPGEIVVAVGYGDDPVGPGRADIVITDQPVTETDTPAGVEPIIVPLPRDGGGATKRSAVVAYHLLWETTHLFLDDQLGSGGRGEPGGLVEGLYPMLYRDEPSADIDAAARESIRTKLAETAACTEAALGANAPAIERAAELVAGAGVVFTCGNGGSATDAADLAHVLGRRGWCLSDDTATLTALTNDVSFDVALARPVRALGRVGDVVIGLSTSGTSSNVLAALTGASDGGLAAIGIAGYGGSAMAELPIDVVLAVESSSVHRIQEAQAALCHEMVRRSQAG